MWCHQRPACCCVCDLVDVLVDVPTVLRWSELDGNWIGAIIPCSELFRWVNYPDFCVLACCSPHLCVGFLFLILYPAAASLLRLLRRRSSLSQKTLSPTIFHTQLCQPQLCHTPSFTDNFVTHHLSHTTFFFVTHHLSQTTLPHTIFHTQLFLSHTIFHRQLCHTPSFTHNFVTHHLSHKSHTQLCQPQLFHTPSFTHNFVTHNFVTHHLSHITLSHKTLSITTFSPHLCTWRHPLSLCVAGVALMALGWL